MLGLVGQHLLEPLVERLLYGFGGEVEADRVLQTRRAGGKFDVKEKVRTTTGTEPRLFHLRGEGGLDFISPASRSYPGGASPACRSSSVS